MDKKIVDEINEYPINEKTKKKAIDFYKCVLKVSDKKPTSVMVTVHNGIKFRWDYEDGNRVVVLICSDKVTLDCHWQQDSTVKSLADIISWIQG